MNTREPRSPTSVTGAITDRVRSGAPAPTALYEARRAVEPDDIEVVAAAAAYTCIGVR